MNIFSIREKLGAWGSSQSVISRFWRQNPHNDGPPISTQPQGQPFEMDHAGENLDPPQVPEFSMPQSCQPYGYADPDAPTPPVDGPPDLHDYYQLRRLTKKPTHRFWTNAEAPRVSWYEADLFGQSFGDEEQLAPAGKPSLAASNVKGKSPEDVRPQNPNGKLLDSQSTPRVAGIAELAPPVSNLPLGVSHGLSPCTPTDSLSPGSKPNLGPDREGSKTSEINDTKARSPVYYDTDKPTCSLNLVCYRSGAKGCELQQIHGIIRSRCPSDESFDAAKAHNPSLIATDDQFFQEMERLYETKMCGFLRRHFSLKTLKAFQVLSYTPITRPAVVPFDDFILQEMMYAYRNPDKISNISNDWVQWMFRLRQKDKRHALEFVEGWNATRIVIAGAVPLLSSCLVGIIWTANGGDAQTAFTVASFILTSCSIILALLAIISSIESSGPKH